MEQDKKQAIALMRYSAIAPLVAGIQDNKMSMNAWFRDVSEKGFRDSDGNIRHFSVSTLKKWYHAYRKNGFDALLPSGRSDCGRSRKLDDALQEEIRQMKREHPRLTAPDIHRQLEDSGSIRKGEVSDSTILRFLNRVKEQEHLETNQDLRRYERAHINEVWCGDSSAGPYLKTDDNQKHRIYIIALLDDASRFVTGVDVFFNDTFVNLMSVIRSAVCKYGVPKMLNFDNGSPYKNKQMELLAARLGCVIHYCKPYSPVQKAKVERWFRTLKDHWMASLDMGDFHTLDELRGSLQTYVRLYNQTVHSSLSGKTPQERFFSEPEYIRRLEDDRVDEVFLLEEQRKVSADNVLSIDNVLYETDCRFSKKKVTVRYTPDRQKIYIADADGNLTPLRLLNKQENAHARREKVHLTGGDQ